MGCSPSARLTITAFVIIPAPLIGLSVSSQGSVGQCAVVRTGFPRWFRSCRLLPRLGGEARPPAPGDF